MDQNHFVELFHDWRRRLNQSERHWPIGLSTAHIGYDCSRFRIILEGIPCRRFELWPVRQPCAVNRTTGRSICVSLCSFLSFRGKVPRLKEGFYCTNGRPLGNVSRFRFDN